MFADPDKSVAQFELREARPTFAADVVRLFERSLDDIHQTMGYHGTSLQALKTLIRTGSLPCNTKIEEHPALFQNFSFFPNAEHFLSHPLMHTFPAANTISTRCGSYAAELAEKHFIAEKWGLSIDSAAHMSAIDEVLTGRYHDPLGPAARLRASTRELLQHLGYDSKTIREDVELAFKQKGVLLAIDLSAMKYGVMNGDPREGDLKIHVPGGLPVSCICGIEPLGRAEMGYLEKLQDEVRQTSLRN